MAATSGSKSPGKRVTVREALREISDSGSITRQRAGKLLANAVRNAQFGLWVGKRRAEGSSSYFAAMIECAALGPVTESSSYVSVVEDEKRTVVDVLKAELRVREAATGLESLGVDPPSSWGGLNSEGRRTGGRRPKHVEQVHQLLIRGIQECRAAHHKESLKFVLREIERIPEGEHQRFGVTDLVIGSDCISFTNAKGKPQRVSGSTLREYFTKAKTGQRS